MSALGILIGFYGYLIPGNINLMILDLYSSGRYCILGLIGILVIAFESIYCFFTLQFFNQINIRPELFHYIELSAFAITLVMGLWMVLEKSKNKNENELM